MDVLFYTFLKLGQGLRRDDREFSIDLAQGLSDETGERFWSFKGTSNLMISIEGSLGCPILHLSQVRAG